MTQKNDKIQLKNQEVEVVECEKDGCGHLMVNIDADQLAPGDIATLKAAKVRVSNPETENQLCVNCEYKGLKQRLADWFESDDDDDDSSFFSGSTFGGSSSMGGFSGGFGGFGGGGFGGGGAARGF